MLWLLALAGCGAGSPVYGLEPVLEPDAEELAWAELLGGENCLVLRYSAPGAGSLRAAVYELRGGAWEESDAAVEFPSVSEEGVLLLSFTAFRAVLRRRCCSRTAWSRRWPPVRWPRRARRPTG